MSTLVRAAGTVPWRLRKKKIEVALVHRPKYDDWSWPKGKLDPGEDWASAAARETLEETGLQVRLGRPLPTSRYALGGQRQHRRKEVRYWAAEVAGGDGALDHEVDEVRWVTPARARSLITYDRDRAQLDALRAARLPTRTVAVVRHAKAVGRKRWKGEDDRRRPLDDAGFARSDALVPLLAAYGVGHVVCSTSTRCAQTLEPFLRRHDAARVTTVWSDELSEEGFEAEPEGLPLVVDRALEADAPIAFCSHGPVLGALLTEILGHTRLSGRHVKRPLRRAVDDGLVKGEALVLHLTQGDRPTVLAVERHLP